MLKYSELIAGLKQGSMHPLYLFYGEEEFLIQEALDLIIKKAVEPGAKDFNFNSLYGRDTAVSEIINLCQTLPFMSEKRLVIVKDFDALKTADLEELAAYLRDPSPSTIFVMVSNQGKYDKKSIVSAVEGNGAVVRFYPLLDRDIVSWIEGRARISGLSVQRDAAQYLWQVAGNDLQKIANELEKAAIYAKGQKTITFEDMKAVAGDFREYTPFDLAAALGSRNREKSFVILCRLLQEGEAPVGLLGSIAWNFRRLMQAKSMEEAGVGSDEILKKLRPPVIFHQAAQFKTQMKSYSLDELRDAFQVLLTADKALKSSGLAGRLVLERMVLKLCGKN